jgi:hypothetical protein
MLLAPLLCYRRRPWSTDIAGNSSEAISQLSPSIQLTKEHCRYHPRLLDLLLFLRVMTRSYWRRRSNSSVHLLMIGCLHYVPTAKLEDYVFTVVTSGHLGTNAPQIFSYMYYKKFGTSVIRISLKTHLLILGVTLPLRKLLCCCQHQFFLTSSLHEQCTSSERFTVICC